MKDGEFWHLKGVSDVGLRLELNALLASGARTDARIVAHLAEVERRKLYSRDGYSSMFKYCREHLKLSECQAFHRLTAAALASRFPIVFGMLEQRQIHLAGLRELRDFLKPENHRELLALATDKSTREIREMLAARFPGQVEADSVRRLRARRVRPVIGAPGSEVEPTLDFDPVTGEVYEKSENAEATEVAEDRDVRYRIQFDAGSALVSKLELARALSSHSNPKGDLEALVERALDAYVEQLQKRRFAQVERPRARKAESTQKEPSRGPRVRLRSRERAAQRRSRPKGTSRQHLSHEARRVVVAQDGMQCAYVAPDGKRCDEQAFLQFHHEDPWGRSQNDDPSNLRIYCAGHNRFRAEQDFGAEHIAERIAEARARSGAR